MWTRYSKSNVGSEKVMILNSLGCSREIWLLQRYLDWTLDESTGVRKQDRNIVFSTVAHNDIGFLLAKSFLYDRVDQIAEKYVFLPFSPDAVHENIALTFFIFAISSLLPDTTRIERYLTVLADQMASDKEYSEFKNFVQEKSKIFEGVERGVQQTLEKIRSNRMWRANNYEQIGRLLSEY